MSIADVARKAGVSYVTVSRALNSPEVVHPETLARIREACRQMNFTPKVIPNRIRTVCLIIPTSSHFYGGDDITITTIVPLLNEKRHHVVVSPLAEIERSPAFFQRAFIAILHQEDETSLAVARRSAATHPFVTIDDLTEELGSEAITVSSEHHQGATLAVQHFLDKGHRRIAYIGPKPMGRGYRERFSAYKKLLEQHGLYREQLVFQNDDSLLVEGIRRLCLENITAVFCTDPALTPKVLYFLRLLGKEVPRDISVIGLEREGGPRFYYPPITCLVQPLKKVAELAVVKLLERMEGRPMEHHKFSAPYALVERESVRAL